MIRYTWKIEDLKTKNIGDRSDVVVQVECLLHAVSDNGTVYDIARIVDLDTSNTVTFTEYENLTKEQVVGWIENQLGEKVLSEYKLFIENRIMEKERIPLHDKAKSRLPWENNQQE